MGSLGLIVFLAIASQTPEARIAGSAACQACHPKTYERWSDSIHGRMIQRANSQTVRSDADLKGGPAARKFWRDGSLYIEENGVENRVDYTLGNRRIQHYLTTKADGEIQVLHTSWDVLRREWFDSADIVPGAPKGFVQQWNSTCFYCHVTQQQQDVKGFDPKSLTYRTSWVESSATCERCHGPLADHAESYAAGSKTVPAPKIPTASFDKLMVCGQCHWPKSVIETGFNTRQSYFDYYTPMLVHLDENTADPNFWLDGRPRRFSTEAAGFFESGCFQSGKATCMSCHDPHWNRTDGNDALMNHPDQYCVSCHADLNKEAHTHHALNSAGASCVGCHMPDTVHGVKAQMRDHTILWPEPENTVRYGIPNACNECHSDKDAVWAQRQVDAWYPARNPKLQLRATAFAMAQKNDPRAVGPLIRLAADTKENPEIRAAAAGFLGRLPSEAAAQELIVLAKDSEPMVRIEAARALGGVQGASAVYVLSALLDDRYRAVRVMAAASMAAQKLAAIRFSRERQQDFDRAIGELRRSFDVEGDHAPVQVRRGNLELALGNDANARSAFELAVRLDSRDPDAYVGLALVEMQQGNRAAALREARKAVEVSPKDVYRKFLEKLESFK